ncbi:MAG TPA: glycoside hydrolase family 88 protein [Bryobacteraceae bacterium]|nr:glycoside hydrolase family 88 protein [Bryobacteraceae bacterium]
MIPRETLIEIAGLAARRLHSHPWKVWFWGDSIGLEGLLDATALTGDPSHAAYVHGLLKGWIAREGARSQFDYTAPGVALLRVYESTGDQFLLDAALRHAEYMAAFRRTTAGAYMRYENAAIELPPELPGDHPAAAAAGQAKAVAGGGPCVFVDSVHFDGPFYAKLFDVTGNAGYRQLALDNVLSQVELLYDVEAGLFHHFWIERTGRPNGVLWARGNGWGLLGVLQTIEHIGVDSPEARPLRDLILRSLARLAGLQHESGAWHTVLTDPSSYVEASTAAFFSDIICRASRLGIVDITAYRPVVEKAMEYLLGMVRPDGALDGVSYETFPSTRVDHYKTMPRGSMSPWGQGPLLTAAWSYHEVLVQSSRKVSEEVRAIG